MGEIINTAPSTNYEFKIEFPEQIDVQTKALLMGATMLAVNKMPFTNLHKNIFCYDFFNQRQSLVIPMM